MLKENTSKNLEELLKKTPKQNIPPNNNKNPQTKKNLNKNAPLYLLHLF